MFIHSLYRSFSPLGRLLARQRRTVQVALMLLPLLALLSFLVLLPQVEAQTTFQAQHVVAPGETLGRIGQRYGVSWRSIAQANNIANPNVIYVGQRLNIPGAGAPPPAYQAQHVVSAGETLGRIGQRYNVSWQSIAQANNIANANLIYVGQRLYIPAASVPPVTPVPGTRIPTISIVSVVPNQSVTIQTANFPANTRFDVLMGAYGTKGVNGTRVAQTDSGQGGAFTVTYSIPAGWHGADRVAIRLQSSSGYYSYNWFYNR